MTQNISPFPFLDSGIPEASRRHLLVVDSLPTSVQVLYQIFNDDYDITLATSGKQALEHCLATPPDLVLLSNMMPDMSGQEICHRLKSNNVTADIPIIFLTPQSNPTDETLALEAGGGDFISEPVNPPVVRARVKTHLTLKSQSDLFVRLALVDEVTGVANRRYFEQALQTEWRHCRRKNSPLALMMIDVDYFSRFNEIYGVEQGDACLQNIGAKLKRDLRRPHDLIARYTSASFACLLPETDLAGAKVKAESFRTLVEKMNISHESSGASSIITLSIGIAARIPEDAITADDLMSEANLALYDAKANGRNCVCTSVLAHPE